MGTIIKPASIRRQTNSVIQALQADNSTMESALPGITAFAGESALQSESWNGLKSQIGAHQSVIQGLICANEDVINDSETLSGEVGHEDLDEDKITQEIEKLKGQNNSYNASIESSKRTIESINNSHWLIRAFCMDALSNCYMMIGHYESLVNKNSEAIAELEAKLREIERIKGATDSLFTTCEGLYSAADEGLKALRGNWNGGSYGIIPGGNWQTKLDNRWKKRDELNDTRAENYLKKQGITQEEINHLKDLGYDMSTLKAQWDSIKDKKEDVEFFKCLLKGQYDAAFNKNSNKLSDNMKTIMTNHFAQMITFPNAGEEVHLSELEKVMNALIKDGEGGYNEKYGLTIAALSETMAKQSATLMLATNPSSNSYNQSEKLFNQYQALYNLTMGLMALDTPSKGIFAPEQWIAFKDWYSIKDLKITDKGNFFFDLEYNYLNYYSVDGNNLEDYARTNTEGTAFITNHGTAGGSLADHSSDITDIIKKKDKLLEDTVIDIFGEAVGILSPVLKLEVDILKNLHNADYSDMAKDIISSASGLSEKTKFLGSLAAIGNKLFEYQEKMAELDAKQNETTKKFFNEILNTGSSSLNLNSTYAKGSDKTYSFPGIPNVQAMQVMSELNQNGLTNYLSDSQKDTLENLYNKSGQKITESEKYLLGNSDKELQELDPAELNSALNMLNETEANGLENVLDWLKDPTNYGG